MKVYLGLENHPCDLEESKRGIKMGKRITVSLESPSDNDY
jgi:hypothetical protein